MLTRQVLYQLSYTGILNTTCFTSLNTPLILIFLNACSYQNTTNIYFNNIECKYVSNKRWWALVNFNIDLQLLQLWSENCASLRYISEEHNSPIFHRQLRLEFMCKWHNNSEILNIVLKVFLSHFVYVYQVWQHSNYWYQLTLLQW